MRVGVDGGGTYRTEPGVGGALLARQLACISACTEVWYWAARLSSVCPDWTMIGTHPGGGGQLGGGVGEAVGVDVPVGVRVAVGVDVAVRVAVAALGELGPDVDVTVRRGVRVAVSVPAGPLSTVESEKPPSTMTREPIASSRIDINWPALALIC
jgi:hypothetical protein